VDGLGADAPRSEVLFGALRRTLRCRSGPPCGVPFGRSTLMRRSQGLEEPHCPQITQAET
jgi:hypothetical protein